MLKGNLVNVSLTQVHLTNCSRRIIGLFALTHKKQH